MTVSRDACTTVIDPGGTVSRKVMLTTPTTNSPTFVGCLAGL